MNLNRRITNKGLGNKNTFVRQYLTSNIFWINNLTLLHHIVECFLVNILITKSIPKVFKLISSRPNHSIHRDFEPLSHLLKFLAGTQTTDNLFWPTFDALNFVLSISHHMCCAPNGSLAIATVSNIDTFPVDLILICDDLSYITLINGCRSILWLIRLSIIWIITIDNALIQFSLIQANVIQCFLEGYILRIIIGNL